MDLRIKALGGNVNVKQHTNFETMKSSGFLEKFHLRKKKKLRIIVIVTTVLAVCAAIAGIAAYFAISHKSSSDTNSPTPTSPPQDFLL